jgi:hypothetical protein
MMSVWRSSVRRSSSAAAADIPTGGNCAGQDTDGGAAQYRMMEEETGITITRATRCLLCENTATESLR